MSRSPDVLPDALLVHRMAALSDRAALAELDARHGMTLYALAYGLLFDGEAADVAVAAALREAWRSAAAFDAGTGSVVRWLAALTRGAAAGAVTAAQAAARFLKDGGCGTRDEGRGTGGLGSELFNPSSPVPRRFF